ncbi:hypothetical protein PIB30_082711 [Stylosanthes scabra]|uniref:Secreted protein n=1 Tax=Stylosanthes scabra TaxID=79078 RepID=A0ABU6UUR1_9FABA|nr:hypothetical protein [Stylosanthes scabra]
MTWQKSSKLSLFCVLTSRNWASVSEKNGLGSWKIMENREPEQKAMPRRQFLTLRHGPQNHTPRRESSSIQRQAHHSHAQAPCPNAQACLPSDLSLQNEDKVMPRRHASTPRCGKLSHPANPAPRPRPSVLHQCPSVGRQTKSRSQSSMTHA